MAENVSPFSKVLHYRGASFDVVNPHASLLAGASDIETPLEVDGLLDSYFSNKHVSGKMPYVRSGEIPPAQESPQNSADSRRKRLYNDPEIARRNIMRIPGATTDGYLTDRPDQESPSTGRGHESTFSRSISRPTALHIAVHANSAKVEHDARGPSTRDRVSSLYPESNRNSICSDPFDLHVSDDEDDPKKFDNIDALVATGHVSRYEASDGGRTIKDEGRPTTVGEGANAPAYVPSSSRPFPCKVMSTLTNCLCPQGHSRTGQRDNNRQPGRVLRTHRGRTDPMWWR